METTRRRLNSQRLVGPYPTYEEWKLQLFFAARYTFTCPYPTYEEWKPCPPVSKAFLNTRSYPTYEEWKLVFLY